MNICACPLRTQLNNCGCSTNRPFGRSAKGRRCEMIIIWAQLHMTAELSLDLDRGDEIRSPYVRYCIKLCCIVPTLQLCCTGLQSFVEGFSCTHTFIKARFCKPEHDAHRSLRFASTLWHQLAVIPSNTDSAPHTVPAPSMPGHFG